MKIEFIGKTLLIEEKGKKTLVIGDLHLGYEESLNLSGVLITRKMFGEMIEELEKVLGKIAELNEKDARIMKDKKIINNKPEDEVGGDNKVVDEIILLGDVKHKFSGNLKQEWKEVLELIDYLSVKCKKIIITRGNHDNYLKTILSKRKKVKIVDYYVNNKIAFVHGDKDFKEIWQRDVKTVIVGHLHPAITLQEGAKSERYKCFLDGKLKRKRIIILPSFFEYSEGTDIKENKNNLVWDLDLKKFNVKIVGDNLEVLDFGLVKELKD